MLHRRDERTIGAWPLSLFTTLTTFAYRATLLAFQLRHIAAENDDPVSI